MHAPVATQEVDNLLVWRNRVAGGRYHRSFGASCITPPRISTRLLFRSIATPLFQKPPRRYRSSSSAGSAGVIARSSASVCSIARAGPVCRSTCENVGAGLPRPSRLGCQDMGVRLPDEARAAQRADHDVEIPSPRIQPGRRGDLAQGEDGRCALSRRPQAAVLPPRSTCRAVRRATGMRPDGSRWLPSQPWHIDH